MDIDLDLYRHEVRVSTNPLAHRAASLVRLSAIDISPDHAPRTFVFIMASRDKLRDMVGVSIMA